MKQIHDLLIGGKLLKLPPLTEDEMEMLHNSIEQDGITSPLEIWRGLNDSSDDSDR